MSDAAVTFLISRLAIASLEFLVVGFLVAVALALCPSIAPRWRRLIWLLALTKPFVTIVTSFFGGVIPMPTAITGQLLGDLLFPAAGEEGLIVPSGAAGILLHVAIYAWLIVTALLLVRVWLRALASDQLIEESIEKGYLLKLSTLRRLDPALVVPPQVRIVVTPEDAGPATLGVLHPAVIVPESLLPWVNKHRDPTSQERERLCQVLRHEVAHVVHRDSLISLVATVMLSVFWFHPIAHFAYRRVRLNNELCCDEHVIQTGVAPSAYVETLMNMVTGEFSRRAFTLSILGDVTPRDVLRRRLHYLLTEVKRVRPKRQRMAYALLVLLVLSLPRFLAPASIKIIPVQLASGQVLMIPANELHLYPGATPLREGDVARVPEMMLVGGPGTGAAAAHRTGNAPDFGTLAEVPGEAGATSARVLAPADEGERFADAADQEKVTESPDAPAPPKRRSHGPDWMTGLPLNRGPEKTPILPPPG